MLCEWKTIYPGLIPQTWSRLHFDGSYKNKDLLQSRRQSYHKSFINLPFGGGGGLNFISSTFEEGWGSMKLVIICIRRSKSNPNSCRFNHTGSVHISLVPRRSLFVRAKSGKERAREGESLSVTSQFTIMSRIERARD